MTHGSLFSGIGGFDLAAQWAGWHNTFQVELDPWCQRVLAKNFPHVTRHTDIRNFDPTPYRHTIDIISGGFPCQPYSQAGQRKGKDDPRHLWPEMLRIIRTIQPRWVVGENVRGLATWSHGLVFEEVCANLESEGYQVQPFILPAASVNAPHERQRIWFIAHRESQRIHRGLFDRQTSIRSQEKHKSHMGGQYPHPNPHPQRQQQPQGPLPKERRRPCHLGQTNAPDTPCKSKREQANQIEPITTSGQTWPQSGIGSAPPPHPDHQRRSQLHPPTIPERQGRTRGHHVDIWDEWTTQPPVCRMDDGIPHRVDRIRGLGNAIVPQLAYRIFDTINQYETLITYNS